MDTSWIELPNNHVDYINGVIEFIKLAKENLVEGRTRCPCKKCKVDKWLLVDEVEHHILFKGFYKPYKNWIHHVKDDMIHGNESGSTSQATVSNQPGTVGQDDMRGLLEATFGPNIPHFVDPNDFPTQSEEAEFYDVATQPVDNVENAKYERLMKAADEDDHPKRPVGFGFGVKQSQVFGVHGILRKGGYESTTTTNNSTELEIMRANMQKENQELRSKLDESNQIFLQALDAIRSGKFSDEAFNAIQLALRKPNSEVASTASGNNTHNGLDELPSSSSPN